MRESIAATRLSGGTKMSVDWLQITARGELRVRDKELLLKVSGTGQEFVLGEDPGATAVLQQLRAAQARGTKITSVTGHVPGWTGRFPDVLKVLEADAQAGPRQTSLLVTDFEVSK
jgi:hypothetical protein